VTVVDGRARRRELSASRLFEAALELLADRPYDELTVEEICAHAGVGRATFFRIFDTKPGLLREFNRRLAADAEARIAAAGDVDLRGGLDLVRAAILDAWRDASPGLAAMARDFSRAAPSSALHSPHPELLALVHRLVDAAVATGEGSGEVPTDLAASLAVIHLTSPIAYALAGNELDVDAVTSVLLDQWCTGMGAGRRVPAARRRATP
jgi:AcrR family transcriptional regulator